MMDSLLGSKQAELLNRLTTGNWYVQYQSIAKIREAIHGQLARNDVERKKLIGKLIDSVRSIESKNCCVSVLNVLVDACKNALVDFSFLLNSLLSLINSKIENSIFCIISITELMINFGELVIGSYSIRNPSHPFIEILRNSNPKVDNFHQIIYQQIQAIYETRNVKCDATILLKPVFVFIFLDSSEYKHLVAKFLINQLKTEQSDDSVLASLVSLYFVYLKILENINAIAELLSSSRKIPNVKIVDIVNLVLRIDAAKFLQCSTQWTALKSLLNNISHSPEEVEELLLVLAENFTRVDLGCFEPFLEFVNSCVSYYSGKSKLHLAVFMPGLLDYLVSMGPLAAHPPFAAFNTQISQLFSQIEKRIYSKDECMSYDAPEWLHSDLFDLIEYEKQKSSEKVSRAKLNLLAAHFILNDSNPEFTKKIIAFFKELNSKWPFLCITLFTLYINKMKMSRDYQVTQLLLNSLVDLVAPKVDVNLFVHVLNSLMHSARSSENLIVRLVCMRQMTKLCAMKYDYLVYEYLAPELVTVSKTLPYYGLEREQLLYTKAFCIKDLIFYRPDYYGQELLATISSLINACAQPDLSGVCAVLIDALAYLCRAEVVDMVSTFNALQPQFKNEKRELAVNAYCRFMSTAASIESLNTPEKEDNFYDRMLRNLWSLCGLKEAAAGVTNAALTALAKFDRSSFKCSFLPEIIQEKLKEKQQKLFRLEENKDKKLDEIITQVPATCYFDLLNLLGPKCYEGMRELLGSALTKDIDSIPRRLVHAAREQLSSQDEQQSTQKLFFDLIKAYLDDERRAVIREAENSPKLVDLSFVLYCYEAPLAKSSSGKLVKRNPAANWQQYEQTLSLLLKKSHFDTSEKNLEYFSDGFKRFIQKAFLSCVEAINAEANSATEKSAQTKQKQRPVEVKVENAWMQAREKLIEISMEAFKSRGVECCAAFQLSILSVGECVADYISENLFTDNQATLFNHSKWLETLVDFILNIKENKVSTKNEFLTSFSYNQFIPIEALKFFYEVFKNSPANLFFLARLQPSCVKLKISNYLQQYLNTIQSNSVERSTQTDSALSLSVRVHIRNSIAMKKEFDQNENKKINHLIQAIFDKFKELVEKQAGMSYLSTLADSMYSLYDEESLFYDENNVMLNLVTYLLQRLGESKPPFSAESGRREAVEALVNLTCVAFKSNLINGEQLTLVYQTLQKEPKLSVNLAFFCRFVYSYGFQEAVNWIQQAHSQWTSALNDFKLGLRNNSEELDSVIYGLLTLVTTISPSNFVFHQISSMSMEVEKILKPEFTVRDTIKFFKAATTKTEEKESYNLEKQKFTAHLARLCYNFANFKFKEVYSVPSNFDYLDELSILRQTFNELNRIIKTNEAEEVFLPSKFEFLTLLLVSSCKSSQVKTLPPLNWYFFIGSLLKSQHNVNKNLEPALFELAISLINTSNSAYSLIKNYLIDTNYFAHLKFDTQLIILKSLNTIWKKLNKDLLKKFLNKLGIFLRQNNKLSREESVKQAESLLESFAAFSKESLEDVNHIYHEIVEFFKFFSSQVSFDVSNLDQKMLAKTISNILINLDDKSLTSHVLKLDEEELIGDKFQMIFWIKCYLVTELKQPISIINTSIDSMLNLIEVMDERSKYLFVDSFAQSMLKINSRATDAKFKNFKNTVLTWFVEFMGRVKSIFSTKDANSNGVDFSLRIFYAFVYAFSFESREIGDRKSSIEMNEIFAKCDVLFHKFITQTFWKQINLKIIEWLMFLFNLKSISQNSFQVIKTSLIEFYLSENDLPIEIAYKFREMSNNSNLFFRF